MRVSLKRAIQWVCAIALLQVGVYYWAVFTKRPRKSLPVKPHPFISPLARDEGTCSFQTCPKVKPGMLNVHLIPHSHIDVGWLKTVDQYYTGAMTGEEAGRKVSLCEGCVRCTLEATVKELLKDPSRTFIFVEMKYFSRFWDEISIEQQEQLRDLIMQRRLELVNGGWVMSDAGVTMYNDIIDQHTLGFDFIRETLGPCASTRTAWHVDQFGHSREHAAIFAQMGYDSLFVGRIDYQDLAERKRTKTLEFVWETSPNYVERSTIFTQATFDGYYAPRNYVYEMSSPLDNVHRHEDERDMAQFITIMLERAKSFGTNHLLVPMGSDFGYIHADRWFKNMDKLINYINHHNAKEGEVQMNLLYSTPSCYTYHVNQENVTFETKTDDFHPYGINPGVYWTGYFTTRGGFKMHIKRAGQILQSCKQLSIFTGLDGTFHKINILRDALAVMQHHDAITGTQKKHVLYDYNRLLSVGTSQCQKVMSMAYQRLWADGSTDLKVMPSAQFCHGLNISSCQVSEENHKFLTSIYNPLAWPVTVWLRIPVRHTLLTISDHSQSDVPFQLAAVPDAIKLIPERLSQSKVEAVFRAVLPPMSLTSYLVTAQRGGPKPEAESSNVSKGVTIENEYLKLTFNGHTGLLSSIYNKLSHLEEALNQDFTYYEGSEGGFRSSGAYVFIPSRPQTKRVGLKDMVKLQVFKNELFEEVHQTFAPWVSQVVRLYRGLQYAEFQWVVGPIGDRDGVSKEVISFFSSDIKNEDKFFTDSNGREVLERLRNSRETWDYQSKDSVSGNYYPITSRMFIQDEKRNVQLTILPDRPQGGGSIYPGTLELMVHRRLRFDDGLGVGEPLDDQGINRQGIVFTGKHFLCFDTIERSAKIVKKLAYEIHMAPVPMFTPMSMDPVPTGVLKQHSFLSSALPENVHILTLDRITQNDTSLFLLRLEHIYELQEDASLSTPATVQLETLFLPYDIVSAEETTLGGNFHPQDLLRMSWETNKGQTEAETGSKDYRSTMVSPFTIVLEPMEIRTFRVQVARNA